MREWTFADIVDPVCKYPKMYFMNGTFGEVLAFLDGYANGKGIGLKGRTGSFFNPFKDWLRTKYGLTYRDEVWRYFLSIHPDEGTALEEFARLWREFEDQNPHLLQPC